MNAVQNNSASLSLSRYKTSENILSHGGNKKNETHKRHFDKYLLRLPTTLQGGTGSLKENMKNTKRLKQKTLPIIIRTATDFVETGDAQTDMSALPVNQSVKETETKLKLVGKVDSSDADFKTNYRLRKPPETVQVVSENHVVSTSACDKMESNDDSQIKINSQNAVLNDEQIANIQDVKDPNANNRNTELLSPLQTNGAHEEQRPTTSGYLIRIQKVKDVPKDHTYMDKIRKTPSDNLRRSRQSFNKSPLSKPGSPTKLPKSRNGFSERILITPVSLKNQEKGFLVTNCRIITPIAPDNEKKDTHKGQTPEEYDNFFLTAVNSGGVNPVQSEKKQASKKLKDITDNKMQKVSEDLPKEIQQDTLMGLEKWKAMVQKYLTEYERM